MDNQQNTIVSSTRMRIRTKVCPCGDVYLYVGHTCMYLRQEEFLDLAQTIHAAEKLIREQHSVCTGERRH